MNLNLLCILVAVLHECRLMLVALNRKVDHETQRRMKCRVASCQLERKRKARMEWINRDTEAETDEKALEKERMPLEERSEQTDRQKKRSRNTIHAEDPMRKEVHAV